MDDTPSWSFVSVSPTENPGPSPDWVLTWYPVLLLSYVPSFRSFHLVVPMSGSGVLFPDQDGQMTGSVWDILGPWCIVGYLLTGLRGTPEVHHSSHY